MEVFTPAVARSPGANLARTLAQTTIFWLVFIGVIWHVLARPMEERDLAARFGASYHAYRAAVRCWWPRLRPYRSSGR